MEHVLLHDEIPDDEALLSELITLVDIAAWPDIYMPPLPANKRGANAKQRATIGSTVFSCIFYGLLICLVAGSFLFSRGEKKDVLGYYFMNVLTGSMQSEIPQDSLVFIKKTDPNTIQIGDDITYMKNEKTAVTHRVVGITENFSGSGERGFETQGIENDSPDFEIVMAVNVVGVVKAHIPMVGKWLEWLRERMAVAMIFAVGTILLVFLLRNVFKKRPEEEAAKAEKGRKKKAAYAR